jgi:hypothetical protein
VDRRKEGGFERALGRSFLKRIGTRFGERELHLARLVDPHTKQSDWRVLTKMIESRSVVAGAFDS